MTHGYRNSHLDYSAPYSGSESEGSIVVGKMVRGELWDEMGIRTTARADWTVSFRELRDALLGPGSTPSITEFRNCIVRFRYRLGTSHSARSSPTFGSAFCVRPLAGTTLLSHL